MPQRAHDDDFGWDVKATSKHDDTPLKGCVTYGTGIHLAFPPIDKDGKKVSLLLFARSSICKKGLVLTNGVGISLNYPENGVLSGDDMVLSNGVGVGDAGYRGEYKAVYYRVVGGSDYEIGDKIVQIALSNGEDIEWEQVATLEELGTTDRGDGGYGSSGR